MLDDPGFELGQNFIANGVKDRAPVGPFSEPLLQKMKQANQLGQQKNAAVAILNIGGMRDGEEQQALCIFEAASCP
jgi:hypothetical protein